MRDSRPTPEEIKAELERLLSGPVLIAAPSLSQFLQYVVHETLAGRAQQIKAYTVAINAWGREREFDPQSDPIVRIQAGRLRRALQVYYAGEGADNPVRIEIPKGAYVPHFHRGKAAPATQAKPAAEKIPAAPSPTLAVVPFLNLSGDSQKALLVDGFGEELSIGLARFSDLSVIAYFSCRRFYNSGLDLRDIGQQLGAHYLVSGTMLQAEDQLRVSAVLSDVSSGSQLWSQQFVRASSGEGLFALQSAIMKAVVAVVGSVYGILPQAIARASRGKPVQDLSVYEAVVQAAGYRMSVTQESYARSRQLLEHVVTVDPEYAPAWAYLAEAYCAAEALGFADEEEPLEKAMSFVNRAIRLDPYCQQAYDSLANVYFRRREPDGVTRACNRILELNPAEAYLTGRAGFWLALVGDFERGLALVNKSIELNPFYPGWFCFPYFLHHYGQERYEEALAEALKFNMPEFYFDPLLRVLALSALGREADAAAARDELLRLKPDFVESGRGILGGFVLMEEIRLRMMTCLERLELIRLQQR